MNLGIVPTIGFAVAVGSNQHPPCHDGPGYASRAVRPISDLNMKTIVINNQKGGVGKTTLAVHLAWFMAETNLRVLVIDV
ncbi:ParA family protein, partial [Bradyrhizobium genomosp. III]|uniref:ParA family protein n=1 Tax=Bradyrhizobium genomosp. III TaxID=2683271 RepID=UPI001FCB1DF0